MDVVSGTELAIALKAGMAPKNLYFHGNNKSTDELKEAIQTNGSGRIIVDNFHELDLLEKLCKEANLNQSILLRISPNVDPHTHSKTTTGILDSKFGFPLATGAAEEAIRQASASGHLDVCGLHIHLGSPIFELEPYQQGIEIICEFASEMLSKHQFSMREFSPGGGFALAYTRDQHPPTIAEYAELITNTLRNELETRNLPNPLLHIEPGRSLIGRSMVAVYTVGARKEIPDVRTYVSLDGGMADNIRPAMYGSKYEAISVDRPLADSEELVTLAGKYCESGDILVENASLPKLEPRELIAIPASGGYNLAMSSNYNMALRPPVIGVKDGGSYLLQRRETLEDLTARDISL